MLVRPGRQGVVALAALAVAFGLSACSSLLDPPLPKPSDGSGPGAPSPDAAARIYLDAIVSDDFESFATVVKVEYQSAAVSFAVELECDEPWGSVVSLSSSTYFADAAFVEFVTTDGRTIYRTAYRYPQTEPWYIIPTSTPC